MGYSDLNTSTGFALAALNPFETTVETTITVVTTSPAKKYTAFQLILNANPSNHWLMISHVNGADITKAIPTNIKYSFESR